MTPRYMPSVSCRCRFPMGLVSSVSSRTRGIRARALLHAEDMIAITKPLLSRLRSNATCRWRVGASWRWRCRRSRGRPNHIARRPRAALQTGVTEYGLVGGENRFNRISICVLARNKSRSETLSSCWSPVAPEAPEGLPGPVNASCEHSGINDLTQIFFWRARPPRRPLSIQVRPIAADVDYRRIRANRANWTHHGLERVDLETPWEPLPLFRSS